MDDRRAQFLILVGDVCLAAMRADLPVVLEIADGTRVTGIPTSVSPTAGAEGVDDTGYDNTVGIGTDRIGLQDIVRCSVSCAELPSATLLPQVDH